MILDYRKLAIKLNALKKIQPKINKQGHRKLAILNMEKTIGYKQREHSLIFKVTGQTKTFITLARKDNLNQLRLRRLEEERQPRCCFVEGQGTLYYFLSSYIFLEFFNFILITILPFLSFTTPSPHGSLLAKIYIWI